MRIVFLFSSQFNDSLLTNSQRADSCLLPIALNFAENDTVFDTPEMIMQPTNEFSKTIYNPETQATEPTVEDLSLVHHNLATSNHQLGLHDNSENSNIASNTETYLTNPVYDNQQMLRRSTRPRTKPSYLENFKCLATTRTSPHTLDKVFLNDQLSSQHLAFSASLDQTQEPKTYKEASMSKDWQLAMKSEIEALFYNNTWKVVDLPPGKTAIGRKWVFKMKRKAETIIYSLARIEYAPFAFPVY